MSVAHATAATGSDSGDGRISKNAWNEAHATIWDVSTTTLGTDTNRNTSSTFTYVAQRVWVARRVKLDAVLWDIYASSDYTMTVRDNEETVLATVVVNGITGPSADTVFTLSGGFDLVPGFYWFRLTAAGAVQWADLNSAVDQYFSPFAYIGNIIYGGTGYAFRGSFKLRFYDEA